MSQVKKKLVHAFTLLGSAEDEVRPETLFDKCDFGKKVSQSSWGTGVCLDVGGREEEVGTVREGRGTLTLTSVAHHGSD